MGKAYRIPSARDRLRKHRIAIKNLQANNRNRDTPRPVAATATSGISAAGDTGGGTGNFLATQGDTMVGPIAIFPNQVAIEIDADGIADISKITETAYTSYVRITTSGASSVLDTLAGAGFDGQLVWVENLDSTFTIAQSTVANGGNIVTADGNDIVLTTQQVTPMIFEAALIPTPAVTGGWRVIAGGGTGGGTGISFPITPPIDDRGTITTNQTFTLTNTTGHVFKATLGADVTITFDGFPSSGTQQEWEVELLQDGTGGRVVTFVATGGTIVNPPTLDTTADTTTIVVFRTNDGGVTVRVGNTVTTSASADLSQWATFPAVADIDYGTFDGINIDRLLFDQAAGESLTATDVGITSDASGNFLTNAVGEYQWLVDGTVEMALAASQLSMSTNIDMNNFSIFDAITVDFDITNSFNPTTLTIIGFDSSSSGLKYNSGATTTNHQFEIGGEPMVLISRLAASRGAITAEQLLAEELLDLATFTNSSPSNGNIWLDLSTGLFQFRQNGVTTGIGEAFTWTADHSAAGFTLTNIGQIDSDATNIALSGKIRLGNNELLTWLKTDNITTVSFGVGASDTLNVLGGDLSLQANNILAVDTLEGVLATPLTLNIPTVSQNLDIDFAGSTEWTFSSSSLGGANIILDNTLTINDSSTDPVANGNFSRNGDVLGLQIPEFAVRRSTTVAADAPEISMVRVDADLDFSDVIGDLTFVAEDTGVQTIYGQIEVVASDVSDVGVMNFLVRADNGLISGLSITGDDNNQRFMVQLGGTTGSRIQPLLGVMGYFVTTQVTDFSLNIGTAGSLEIPQFSNGSPSITNLNSAFGAFDGAIGQDTADGKLYVRKSSTVWSFYSESGTVT